MRQLNWPFDIAPNAIQPKKNSRQLHRRLRNTTSNTRVAATVHTHTLLQKIDNLQAELADHRRTSPNRVHSTAVSDTALNSTLSSKFPPPSKQDPHFIFNEGLNNLYLLKFFKIIFQTKIRQNLNELKFMSMGKIKICYTNKTSNF
jgi:hypothetical protein